MYARRSHAALNDGSSLVARSRLWRAASEMPSRNDWSAAWNAARASALFDDAGKSVTAVDAGAAGVVVVALFDVAASVPSPERDARATTTRTARAAIATAANAKVRERSAANPSAEGGGAPRSGVVGGIAGTRAARGTPGE